MTHMHTWGSRPRCINLPGVCPFVWLHQVCALREPCYVVHRFKPYISCTALLASCVILATMLQGITTSTTPFSLWPKAQGPDFWQHIKASPRHAATFDGAMRACNHTGARMAVEQYPWNGCEDGAAGLSVEVAESNPEGPPAW
jgi:hypothetical protein